MKAINKNQYRIFKKSVIVIIFSLSIVSCTTNTSFKNNKEINTTLFSKVSIETSNILFKNTIREDLEFNFLNYPYLYTGAGVAVGDINNDDLQDIYLTSNFGSNKLYNNKGDFVFEDITISSKTEDHIGFTTGATMMDVNNDGWLDIYVSKAGSLDNDEGRRNLLFINKQDGTFVNEAKKWGVDDPGYSTQAYSFDYDKDGDLDLYVLNYRYDFKNNTKISGVIQSQIEETTSDQLYRNDGTVFTKVTGEAGIYNKSWGLAGTVGDFNNDGWDDIYISNDYLEPDVMYINQQDGTFKNEINSRINHISFNSMGADYADLNNDSFPDLITVDMLAENYARGKENMASMSTSNFMKLVEIGYHHAYMANMLHYNIGNGKFNESAQLSGVVKTDWSWAPLIADFDNDGLKDIFISNGVYKDYHNQDFRIALKKKNAAGESMTLEDVLDMMPSEKLDNYIYKNNGDFTFSKKIKEWGLEDPSFSNGAAYADFDNDGDLDIIVNNTNDNIGLYRNNNSKNYIQVKLKGPENNSLGIGASVYIINNNSTQFQKLYLARGFESSVSPLLNFGLGDITSVSEVIVEWPDKKVSRLKDIKANQKIVVDYNSANIETLNIRIANTNKKIIDPTSLGIDYLHKENYFNDYSLQLLLPQKQSTKGTGIAKADVNGDGLEDFYVGNALGAHASLFIQNNNGSFTSSNKNLWKTESKYEDANAIFFDADSDGDQDLYVVSAGYELKEDSSLLQDRLYKNDGKGNFTLDKSALPKMLTSSKSVIAGDYDGDGDLDLFVGGNVISGKYPLSPKSYLLNNENGIFKDVTKTSNTLSEAGMVSEAIFTDYDNDTDLDIMIVGEWMAPTFYNNQNGIFEKDTMISGLENSEGWYFSVTAGDYDNDGDQDYVIGNLGKNNKFHPSEDKPLYIYAKDFDNNGSFDVAMSKINHGKLVPVRGKECSSEQNPFLLDKIQTYKEFASHDMNDIYGEENLEDAFQSKAYNFKSIYLENSGNRSFTIKPLPNEAQMGPTLSFISSDINNDGHLDIMGIGAIYDAEVETIRYDSNIGYVLLGDGKGEFNYSKSFAPYLDKDSKNLKEISINEKKHYVVVSNNSPIDIFSY